MGQEESKMPNLRRVDLEICLERILGHLKLQLDRKVNELITNDMKLREKMTERLREYSEVSIELIGLVNIKKNIDATKIVLRYCKTLKDFSMKIVDAQNQQRFDYIEDLKPYIEGIIWSSDKLNNKYVQEFNNIVYKYFGKKIYNEIQRFGHIDVNLRNCFAGLEPTPSEIKHYLEQFLKRYKLEMKDFPANKGGNGGGNGGMKKKDEDKLDKLLDELKFDSKNEQKAPNHNNINLNNNQNYPSGQNNQNYPSGQNNNNIPPYGQNNNIPPYGQNNNNIPPYGQNNNNIPPYGQNNNIPPYGQNNNIPPYGQNNNNIPPSNYGQTNNNNSIPPYNGSNQGGNIPAYNGSNTKSPMNPNNRPDQALPKDGNLDDLLNSLSQKNGMSKIDNKNGKNDNNLDDMINNLTGDTKKNSNSQKGENNFDDMINNLQDDGKKNNVNETRNNQNLIDELNKKNFIIGQRINENDVNYPEAKKYDKSFVNKDNDYKIDFGNIPKSSDDEE